MGSFQDYISRPTRRQALAAAFAASVSGAQTPKSPLVDTHVHLFAADQQRFPYHPNSPYKPAAQSVEDYVKFATSAGINRAVIVHPEPYQDDHRYLEYAFSKEPSPMFFKGTCLFDPIATDTPVRMDALMKRNPGRIVALRIHEVRKPGTPPSASGPIKERDLRSKEMLETWRKARAMGLAIQMHFLPHYARPIGDLASRFPDMRVILDHLGRAGQGTPEEFEGVLKLAELPSVVMKFAEIKASSKQPYPYADVKPLVRRAFDAFGPDRMIWGSLGNNRDEFDRQARLFDAMFDFASDSDRVKIRGGNAIKLFRW
jgi:predicted TIM-barrel fold metal-dependent hydrolase